jgi:type II secretory pathway pseudopilin PulG
MYTQIQKILISPSEDMRGFTFLETVVAVAITGVVMATLGGGIAYFYRTNSYVLEQAQAVDSARRGIEFSVRDLREATYGDDGSYPVQLASSNTITFFSDIDGDASVEKVRYYLSGTTLYRGVTESAGAPLTYVGAPEKTYIIADHVRNSNFGLPAFTFIDTAGNILAEPINVAEVAFVTMSVVVNINPNRAPEEFTLSGSAMLRNLRYE